MITEAQQEQASLYVLGAMTAVEAQAFEGELHSNRELREFVHSLQTVTGVIASSAPSVALPGELREKVLRRIDEANEVDARAAITALPGRSGFRFLGADETAGWKRLPV